MPKACKINVSQDMVRECLLKLPKTPSVYVYNATVEPGTGILTLYLTGDRKDIPNVKDAENIPHANVLMAVGNVEVKIVC